MSGKLLLNSWKEIAEFVGRTERTVQRWERQYGFPVHRPAGRERSAVIALASEIEAWSAKTWARGNSLADVPLANASSLMESCGPEPSQATVLCIDCHPGRLETRKKLLEFGGYRVLIASDVRSGLRLLRTNHVYIVVLDYSVPDLDGEGAARLLQKHRPDVPVLMLSHKAKGIPQGLLNLIGASEQMVATEGVPVES